MLLSSKSRYNTNEAPLLPKLRGKFAEFLKEVSHVRLRILSSSTCVGLRYGHLKNSLEAFLGSMDLASWKARKQSSPPCSRLRTSGFTWKFPLPGGHTFPIVCMPILLRPPIVQTLLRWCRNVDLLSIAYAFRPRLRDRLTLSGLAFLRKP